MSIGMTQETKVSESRFYMWRAIFAMAHADGVLDKKEEAFIDKYLSAVPFDVHQRAVIEDDLIHPRDPGEMLSHVGNAEDRSMFFQFARAIVWSDGSYDQQEEKIMNRLFKDHMEGMDLTAITGELKQTRENARLQRMADEEYFKADADRKVGIGAIIGQLFAKSDDPKLPKHGVTDSQFNMWRAVFALAHADDEVSNEEQAFMYKVLAEEDFSSAQRLRLENDMEYPQNTAEMFKLISNAEDRNRFFYLARLMCWSDGNFDEQEQKIMVRLKQIHHSEIDFDHLVSNNALELADEDRRSLVADAEIFNSEDDGGFLKRVLRRIRR